MTRFGFYAALILAGLVLTGGADAHGPAAAPGHYDGHAAALGEPGDPKAVTRTMQVEGQEMKFTPATLTIRRGDTVRFVFKNTGQLKHEIMIGTQKELNDHAALMEKHPDMEHDDANGTQAEAGKSGEFVWKFTKTGQFHFGCLLPGHYQQGMKGTIVVR
jgi:uncharacterized cupredoxin-like copper-binding protein